MKLQMFKKMVSLVSAFTIVATCLAGLNFSVSAAEVDRGVEVSDPKTEIIATAGNTFDITPKYDSSKSLAGISVNGNDIMIEGDKPTDEIMEEDESGTEVGTGKFPDVKWIIETSTPGKLSGNAFFRNNNKTGDKNGGFSVKSVSNTDYKNYGLSSPWELTLGGLKAAGQFNNVVDVRLVSKDYKITAGTNDEKGQYFLKTDKMTEYLSFRVFIQPAGVDAPVCTATKATNTPAKGIVFTPPTYKATGGVDKNAILQLDEGKSFKLPFKANTGDSGIIWTSSNPELFTVVNGTVKAIRSGSGSITVKSVNDTSKSATVTVNVTPVVTAIRSNVSTLNLITKINAKTGKDVDGDIQYVTVSPKTSTGANITYKLSLLKDQKGITFVDTNGLAITSAKGNIGGALTFGVKTTSAFTGLEKGQKVVVTPSCNDKSLAAAKTIKPINITLKTTTYPDYVKNFKETVKADKVTGFRVINVPVGGTVALNLSINPVTAINSFKWDDVTDTIEEVVSDINTSKTGSIDISKNGDVVKGVDPGTCYYQATSGKDENVKSSIYKINVYKPASSFEFNDKIISTEDAPHTKMVVKGGYLMEADNANTKCDKTIEAGKPYTFTEPSCSSAKEPVVWTSNKPEVAVYADGGVMNLIALKNGVTATITGTSQYTKQKYSFKVTASGDEEKDSITEGSFVGADSDDKIVLKKGEKFQLIPFEATGFAISKDKVKFDPENKKLVSVSDSGVITGVNATGLDGVTVTMYIGTEKVYEATVVVTDAPGAAPAVSFPAASINGAKGGTIKPTLKNVKAADVKWEVDGTEVNLNKSGQIVIPAYVSETVVVTEVTKDSNNTESVSVSTKLMKAINPDDNSTNIYAFDDATPIPKSTKTYTIVAKDVDGNELGKADVTAYNGFMTKQPKIADPADAYAGAVDLKSMKNIKVGIKAGQTYKLPIALDSQVIKDGKKVTIPNDLSVVADEIEWTVSNNYIVTNIDNVDDPDRIATADLPAGGKLGDEVNGVLYYGKYYHECVFTTSSEYTGKVTLTGITKNGGKKITLTLYVVK